MIINIKAMKGFKLRLSGRGNESYNFTSGKWGQGTCQERDEEIQGNIKIQKLKKNTLLEAYQIITIKAFYLIQALGPSPRPKQNYYYAVLWHDVQEN